MPSAQESTLPVIDFEEELCVAVHIVMSFQLLFSCCWSVQ